MKSLYFTIFSGIEGLLLVWMLADSSACAVIPLIWGCAGAVALVCFQHGGDRAWILLTGLIWAAACCPHTLGQQGQHLAPAHRSCSGGPCPPLETMMAAVATLKIIFLFYSLGK